MSNTAPSGWDLPRAYRAVRALLANPDDTAQAFRVVDALAGRAPQRNLRRFAATPVGARVLAERRSLVDTLRDRARLERLPEGSLGRAYLRFVDAEGISPDGLVDASQTGADRPATPEAALTDLDVFQCWVRDTHDLWHTATGYQGDLVGEASLLAFSFAQIRHPGVGLMVMAALLRTVVAPPEPDDIDPAAVRRTILQGFMRGLRAPWMLAEDWEALLAQPIDEVRARLRLGDPPRYRAVRTAELAA